MPRRTFSPDYGSSYDDHGPFAMPRITKVLLIANVAVYVLGALVPAIDRFLLDWASAWPRRELRGEVWRPFTYMFLHGGLSHLLFNMLALFFFGPALEREMGERRYIGFYVACGLGGALVHLAVALIRGHPDELLVGASGALYGLLVASAYYFPNQIIYMMMLTPVRMKWAVCIYAAITFLGSIQSSGGGVSHITHLGGLVTGFLLLYGRDWIDRLRGPRRRRGGKVVDIYDDPHWRLDR